MSIPGPANYSTVDSYRYKQKKPINVRISKSPKAKKEEKSDLSPTSYESAKAKDKVLASNKRFSIGKTPKQTIVKEMADKNKIPGVGSYSNL